MMANNHKPTDGEAVQPFVYLGMRKFETLLGMLLMVLTWSSNDAWGQATIVNAPDSLYMAIDTMGTAPAEAHWDVVNNTDAALSLMVTRTFLDTVSPFNYPWSSGAEGSYERFCWGPTCFQYGADSSPTNEAFLVTLNPGQSTDTFRGDFYPNGVTGNSTLRYCFHGTDGDSLSVCHDITYVVTATAAVEPITGVERQASFSLMPNPVKDIATLQFDQAQEGTVELRNLVGQTVGVWAVNPGTKHLQISVGEFGEGMWLATYSVKGRVVSTQRLIVQ